MYSCKDVQIFMLLKIYIKAALMFRAFIMMRIIVNLRYSIENQNLKLIIVKILLKTSN